MTSFQEAAGQSSAPKTLRRNEALSESNTSVLADLWPFKEARVTALPPRRMMVCGCPLTVPGTSPSPGGGGYEAPGSRITQFGENTEE